MTDKAATGEVPDRDSDLGRSASRGFHHWLQVQLRARKLTQRQLAHRSGVDHSTISRLLRGDRMPSLRTVTMLARSLGMANDAATFGDPGIGGNGSPAARVEYALRSDDSLSEAEIAEIMRVYLAARQRRRHPVIEPAPHEGSRAEPVALVVQVSGVVSPSASVVSPRVTRARSD
jgi:transcriptional regulator with XRE-family HTH domain